MHLPIERQPRIKVVFSYKKADYQNRHRLCKEKRNSTSAIYTRIISCKVNKKRELTNK
ncbi:hypothetical protein HMPREF0973_02680 [Prevotella veroralis F0319]|uniref:Uncharacterized protein n=1 Tax=Prevotella veroralis F0319 TaxID=649761 RepID=C9MSR0_9BACT|nr:hypothetical protein HMPREF0973_02680 [Prevotella veroralis F0319]